MPTGPSNMVVHLKVFTRSLADVCTLLMDFQAFRIVSQINLFIICPTLCVYVFCYSIRTNRGAEFYPTEKSQYNKK